MPLSTRSKKKDIVIHHETCYTDAAWNADRSTSGYVRMRASNFKVQVAYRGIPKESLESAVIAMAVGDVLT